MAKIVLDTMCPDEPDFLRDLEEAGITMTEFESGGHWPIYTYQGTRQALEALIEEWWDDTDLFESIEEDPFRVVTVQELIEKLQKCSPNKEVLVYSKDHVGELRNIFVQDVIEEDDYDKVEIVI